MVEKIINTPTNATAEKTALMLNPPLLIPDKAKIKAESVVPTLAPKINPDPCLTVTILACAKPTVIMDDADEDCTKAVDTIPIR